MAQPKTTARDRAETALKAALKKSEAAGAKLAKAEAAIEPLRAEAAGAKSDAEYAALHPALRPEGQTGPGVSTDPQVILAGDQGVPQS